MTRSELPIPPHFDPESVGRLWKVPYEQRAEEAERWAKEHHLLPCRNDRFRICLLIVDVQNTFCLPGFELFVAGRSGTGAVDDTRRLCGFIYRNLHVITQIVPTLDTHQVMQIFHAVALVNEEGFHPAPFTLISEEESRLGRWRLNHELYRNLGLDEMACRRYLPHYTRMLKEGGKYELTVWPYHAMLGSIGHALVPAVEEAIFFHSIARLSQPDFQIKGSRPLTEHYSVLGPEVARGPGGEEIGERNEALIQGLLRFDAVIIAGQAKSHCVAWTIDDLLKDLRDKDDRLVEKIYLLEDCTSPVVIPGALDYTDQADAAFRRFADAGMKIVRSTDPLHTWPGIRV
ncbi:MAG: isochorismatase [Thermodesulfobacteriota bacterium]